MTHIEQPSGDLPHSVFNNPDCSCDRCRAVYDEWAVQAMGFQRWFDSLDDQHLRSFFGMTRVTTGGSDG